MKGGGIKIACKIALQKNHMSNAQETRKCPMETTFHWFVMGLLWVGRDSRLVSLGSQGVDSGSCWG